MKRGCHFDTPFKSINGMEEVAKLQVLKKTKQKKISDYYMKQ
jgi:hypothetical protein